MIPSNLDTNFLASKANDMVNKVSSFFTNGNGRGSGSSNGNINYQMLLIYIIIAIVVIYFLFGLLKGPIVIVLGVIAGWIAYKSFTTST